MIQKLFVVDKVIKITRIEVGDVNPSQTQYISEPSKFSCSFWFLSLKVECLRGKRGVCWYCFFYLMWKIMRPFRCFWNPCEPLSSEHFVADSTQVSCTCICMQPNVSSQCASVTDTGLQCVELLLLYCFLDLCPDCREGLLCQQQRDLREYTQATIYVHKVVDNKKVSVLLVTMTRRGGLWNPTTKSWTWMVEKEEGNFQCCLTSSGLKNCPACGV